MAYTIAPAPGIISIANGATDLTGTGTSFTSYRKGTLIVVAGLVAQLASDPGSDTAASVVQAWPNADVTDSGYQAIAQSEPAVYSQRVRDLLEALSAAPPFGIVQAFSSTTTAADPGAGVFRLNNATIANATAAYFDNLDAFGSDISAELDQWTAGRLKIVEQGNASVFAAFDVTAVTDSTGYRTVTLSYVDGAGTFTSGAACLVGFAKDGDVQTVVAGAGIAVDSTDPANPVVSIGLPLSGFRNKIINGDFDIAQRGTSFGASSGGQYTLDRWSLLPAGGATMSAGRSNLLPADTSIAGLSCPHVVTVGYTSSGTAGDVCVFQQAIEDARTLSGKRITVTFWAANGDASGRKVAVEIELNYGTGGGTPPTIASQIFTLASGFNRFDAVFDVPDVPSGQTVASGSFAKVNFWLSAGSTFAARASNIGFQSGSFFVGHVSVVEGDATAETDPFSPRHIQQEEALCRRYYRVCGELIGHWSATTVIDSIVDFSASPMRAAPTLSVVNGAGNLIEFGVAQRDATSMGTSGVQAVGGGFNIHTSTATLGALGAVQPGAIAFDAEF